LNLNINPQLHGDRVRMESQSTLGYVYYRRWSAKPGYDIYLVSRNLKMAIPTRVMHECIRYRSASTCRGRLDHRIFH
jgi:hypothetical protein